MMFSGRLPRSLASTAIARATAEAAAHPQFIDLTETNPTRVGLAYPADLLRPLSDPTSLTYSPEPFGLAMAREAVAAHYASQGAPVDPAYIILCASTSEAYSWIFKLLCNPGDSVLAPRPSYPLFDGLADLESIRLKFYESHVDGLWSIDMPDLLRQLTPDTRAILTVSPNNPTGALTRHDDAATLGQSCAAHGLAWIRDEVFAEYLLEPGRDLINRARPPAAPCLSFRLGGLSKLTGLPQLKLAWIRVEGPDSIVREAMARMEFIADTFLSVSTPVQHSLPSLLHHGATIRTAIHERLRYNLSVLQQWAGKFPSLSVPQVEGGWSAVIRIPTLGSEEDLVIRLLQETQLRVHPGYFFNFSTGSHLVLSLLAEPDRFREGLGRLAPVLGRH